MASKAEETKKIVKKPVLKSTKTTAAKPAKKEAVKKVATEKVEARSTSSVQAEVKASSKTTGKQYAAVSIDVVDVSGKVTGKVSLPGEIFGDKVNKALIAQAVRVYLANQRQGTVSTKTRGEVEGSTAKIYRQKGTGRARHGSKRAPIFVKGGVVFGPKPRDYSLSLPQKMKKKALFSALSAKVKDKEVTVIDGLGAIEPKTKVFAQMLKSLGFTKKKQNLLFVTAGKEIATVLRAGRNVKGVNFLPSKQVNTYEVLAAGRLIVMKDAIDEMKEHFLKK